MATQVQFRRGTTSQNNAFTGAAGEFTVDTQVWTIRLHDGTTAGGRTIASLNATQTLTNKTLGSGSTWNGNTVGLTYGGTGASLTAVAGAIAYSTGSAFALSLAGTSGQVLTSGGTSGPTWVNASSLSTGTATTATTATNISGGSAGYLMYQTDTNTTGFIAPGTSGYVLRSTGASTAPSWVTSALTIGSTAVQVGDTQTSFAGLTSLDGTSGSTSYFATPTAPVVFAGATTLTLGYGSTASSTTNISTGAVGSGNTKTINIGTGSAAGSTTNINLGDADGGTVTVNKDLVVSGNLTVNGTTTTINSTTLDIDDLNITVASGAGSSSAANGAGLTVDTGGSNPTILYTHSTASWNINKPLISSTTDYWKVPVGSVSERPGSPAVGMIRYNSEQTTFEGYSAGAWSSLGGVKSVDAYTYILAETSAGASNGDLDFYAENSGGNGATQVGQWNRTNLKDYTGTLVGTQTTQNVFNATATTVNAFGASTATTVGATTGTHTIRNATVSFPNATAITTGQTTVSLLNTTATTVNFAGAATTVSIGAGSTGARVDLNKDVYIAGNLYVTGTQTNAGNTTISGSDSAIYTNAGATGNTKDIGFIGEYKPSSTTLYAGLVKDASDNIWKFFSAPTNAPTAGTVVDFTGATYDSIKVTAVNKVTITEPASSATLTISNNGSLITSGGHSLTLTTSNTTNVTLPTTGTLATLSGTETLANKTLTTPNIGAATATSLTATGGGVLVRNASTQDGIEIRGRSGGTGNWEVILTPATLSADRTFTFPDVSGTVLTSASTSESVQFGSFGVGTAASGTSGEIRATNAITSYYSDDRLKTKTGNIQNALEKVLSLDGFHYHANETAVALGYDSSKQEIGLSAQQVQAVLPQVIAPAPIDPQYMTLQYERLVPLLVEAIKEQQKQIEELKAKLGN
jgi:hypothetical protein